GTVVQHAPVLYQTTNGVQTPVSGSFVLEGGTQVGFAVGQYDHGQALVIDPTLGFSSYLGGNILDKGNAIAVDGAGDVFVAGSTQSTQFPTSPTNSITSGPNDTGGNQFAFVAEFSPTGTLLYSAKLGGVSGHTSTATAIAVDAGGLIYITGSTDAPDFPT